MPRQLQFSLAQQHIADLNREAQHARLARDPAAARTPGRRQRRLVSRLRRQAARTIAGRPPDRAQAA